MGASDSIISPSFSIQKEKFEIVYGAYMIKGQRSEMEDYSRCVLNLGEQFRAVPGKTGLDKEFGSFFGLFDGHSGNLCAEYIAEHLPSFFTSNPNYPNNIPVAAVEAFRGCDLQFIKDEAVPNNYNDGSTAIVAIIWEEVIYVINSGDSRCILAHGGQCIPMSIDHSPSNPTEEERIKKNGGHVKNNRVRGKLGVARGFGAYRYKHKENYGDRLITVEPEVKTFQIDKQTEFLILATDGIWDKISNEEAIQFVRERLGDLATNTKFQEAKEKFVYDICIELVKEADTRKSTDNISCIIIVFNHHQTSI
jgi:serine/threonine protein phosphatase PrpC